MYCDENLEGLLGGDWPLSVHHEHLFLFAYGAERDRDEFERQCRARGGVPVIEREYRCMTPEMFR
jgi:hypothetical protein